MYRHRTAYSGANVHNLVPLFVFIKIKFCYNESMIKRKALIIATLVMLISVGLTFLFAYKYFQKAQYSNQMVNGTVKGVKDGSIVVEGLVRSSDPQNHFDKKRTIEFAITSQTILKKSIIRATIDQIKSGKPFHPETVIATGTISDLAEGIDIFKITSKDNLLSAEKAIAAEIYYVIHDFPLPAIY